jgi:hypothetical protein
VVFPRPGAVEEEVIHRLARPARRPEVLLERVLAHEIVQATRSQRRVEIRLVFEQGGIGDSAKGHEYRPAGKPGCPMTLSQAGIRLNGGPGRADNSGRLNGSCAFGKVVLVSAVPSPQAEALRLENQKIRRLRLLVDLASSILRQNEMPLVEAIKLVRGVRMQALSLFPGKERTYDMLYAPRFVRIPREKYGVEYPEF